MHKPCSCTFICCTAIKKLDDKPTWQATGSYEEGIVNTLEERFFPSKAIDGYTDSDPNPNSVYTMYHSRWNENKYPWLQVINVEPRYPALWVLPIASNCYTHF